MMLNSVIKNVLPLLSIAALSVGCGKKINDASVTDGNNNGREHPWIEELPSAFRQIVDDSSQNIETSELPKNGWVRLPSKLVARSGPAEGREVHIYLNLNHRDEYEYKCVYKDLNFVHCLDQGGTVVIHSWFADYDFPLDKNSLLKMELINPTHTSLVLESHYQIEWK